MFKIADEPQFRHPVEAKVPVDGGYRDEKFEATFRVIDPEEQDTFDMRDTKQSTEFLRRVIVTLHDIGDAQGEPLSYSDEVRDQVLRLPWARGALARAYFNGISGAKLGN